jgi:phage/plasmid primase-like uncharacterized protein
MENLKWERKFSTRWSDEAQLLDGDGMHEVLLVAKTPVLEVLEDERTDYLVEKRAREAKEKKEKEAAEAEKKKKQEAVIARTTAALKEASKASESSTETVSPLGGAAEVAVSQASTATGEPVSTSEEEEAQGEIAGTRFELPYSVDYGHEDECVFGG